MTQTDISRALTAGALGFLLATLSAPVWSGHIVLAGALAAGGAVAGLAATRRMARRGAPDAAPAMPHEPVLDLQALAALRALGDDAFVREVAGQFEAEGRLLMLRLAQATAARNASDFAAHAHALRSGAANVGARRLYALCLAWREAKGEELSGIAGATRLTALEREFEAACDALRAALVDNASGQPVTPMARAG